eukprot:scaffold148379_cov32-Tisochrysis_lutea.AAC.3
MMSFEPESENLPEQMRTKSTVVDGYVGPGRVHYSRAGTRPLPARGCTNRNRPPGGGTGG